MKPQTVDLQCTNYNTRHAIKSSVSGSYAINNERETQRYRRKVEGPLPIPYNVPSHSAGYDGRFGRDVGSSDGMVRHEKLLVRTDHMTVAVDSFPGDDVNFAGRR